MMGFSKEEKTLILPLIPRWIKTLFFLTSLLLFSTPILLVVADALLPSAIFSASLSPSYLTLQTIYSHMKNYDFHYSLIDIPLLSIVRSLIILFVYSFCDGPRLSRRPYLGIVTVCSTVSLVFVNSSYNENSGVKAMEVALLVSSLVLAIGHLVVAYRTSCRERRKLLVYRIDIEVVSACNNGFPRYQKIILQEARTK